MAWLKTPNGTLVNLEQVAAIKLMTDYGRAPEVGIIVGGDIIRVGGDEVFLEALEQVLDLYVIEDNRSDEERNERRFIGH